MTILELMTVLTIIAILAAISIPTFLTIKDEFILGATAGNLHIIRKALTYYMVDSANNRYPMGPMDYSTLIAQIPFANMPANESDARIDSGSLIYTSNGATYIITARSTNSDNQLFTVTPSSLVRN
jgi:type II secretory pathway pseudopilin PulG